MEIHGIDACGLGWKPTTYLRHLCLPHDATASTLVDMLGY